MSHDDGLERELSTWFAQTAMPGVPAYVEEVIGATRSAGQRRRWDILRGRLRSGSRAPVGGALGTVPWRTIGVIALLLLLLAAMFGVWVASERLVLPPPYGPARNGLLAYSDGDIHVVDPETGRRTTIVAGPTYDVAPRWSLDGTRIAFLRTAGQGDVVVVTDADGSHEVASRGAFVDGDTDSLAWSPDGRWIAFASGGPGAAARIHFVDTADGRVSPLETGYVGMEVHWRPPDGHELMFVGGPWPSLGLRLYAMAGEDGSGVPTWTEVHLDVAYRGVTDLTSLRPVGWMPDGRRFVYQVERADLAATVTRVLDVATGVQTEYRMGYGRISNRGDRIVGFDGQGQDRQLCVARMTSGHCVPVGTRYRAPVPEHNAALQWSPDDELILVQLRDGSTVVLDPDGQDIPQPSWLVDGGESWQRVAW